MSAPKHTAPGQATGDLAGLSAGLITIVLSLRDNNDFGHIDELRSRITSHIQDFEREGLGNGIPHRDLEEVKFPLIAFIDEVIVLSEWEYRDDWRDQTLQLEFFGERMAGARFFERLDEIRRAGPAKRGILEVYHLCLLLGFQGQHRITGQSHLQQLTEDVGRELGHDPRKNRELRLAPHGKTRAIVSAGQQGSFPSWKIVGLAAGVLVVVFGIFWIWIENYADRTF